MKDEYIPFDKFFEEWKSIDKLRSDIMIRVVYFNKDKEINKLDITLKDLVHHLQTTLLDFKYNISLEANTFFILKL